MVLLSAARKQNKAVRENKAVDIVLGYKKGKKALLIVVSVPSDFSLNNAEIKTSRMK